jgi:transcriptional regulator with XRE-family HTH domain
MIQFFGTKLKYLRLQQAVSQTELARNLALASHTSITHLEAGRKEPSLDLILRCAVLFTTTTDYLLRDDIPVVNADSHRSAIQPSSHRAESFGMTLRQLRRRQRLTQADLAMRLDLASQAYVNNLAAGRKTLSPELVVRIADHFGVTTDYLLRDDVAVEGIDAQGE